MGEKKKSNVVIIVLLAVVIALLAVVVVFMMTKQESTATDPQASAQGDAPTAQSVSQESGTPTLSFATEGITLLDDQDAFQSAIQDLYDQVEEGYVSLEYQNEAFSEDGKVFSCYIGNAEENAYNMYIQLATDIEFTDQLFLSGLIRPGERFQSIELERALDAGTHTVYCAFTQVEDDMQTIHAQTVITLQFHVNEQ